MASTDTPQRIIDDNREKPTREDGRPWTNAMDRAAQLRAQGKAWPDVAEATGLTKTTVENYPSKYPPFGQLVAWYRDKIWSEEVERLVRQLQPDAMQALQDVLTSDSVGQEGGPSYSDVVQAARAVAAMTGLQERQKLQAREEAQGTTAERHEIGSSEDGRAKIDQLLGLGGDGAGDQE